MYANLHTYLLSKDSLSKTLRGAMERSRLPDLEGWQFNSQWVKPWGLGKSTWPQTILNEALRLNLLIHKLKFEWTYGASMCNMLIVSIMYVCYAPVNLGERITRVVLSCFLSQQFNGTNINTIHNIIWYSDEKSN